MKFPAKADQYISKDELATYLETYAEVNDLPVRSSTRVTRLSFDGETYVVEAAGRRASLCQRGGRNGRLSSTQCSRLRPRPQPRHQPDAFGPIQAPVPARRWSGPRRRIRQLGRRHRPRSRRNAYDLSLRKTVARHSVPPRAVVRSQHRGTARPFRRRQSTQHEHTRRAQSAAETNSTRRWGTNRAGETDRSRQGRSPTCRTRDKCRGRTPDARRRYRCSTLQTSFGARASAPDSAGSTSRCSTLNTIPSMREGSCRANRVSISAGCSSSTLSGRRRCPACRSMRSTSSTTWHPSAKPS